MKRCLTFFLCSFLLTGCATLFKSNNSSALAINSSPAHAKVFVNGTYRGTTPVNLKMSPDRAYDIRLERDGYDPLVYHVGKKVGTKWIILDILGGGIPILVDAITGNWYELEESDISLSLNEKQEKTVAKN